MALLVTALRRDFPQYAPWFSIEGLSLGKRTISNYNLLIGRYAGADGMKTGFVCASGFNQIGSATRNGRTLVAIVLGERSAISRAEAAARLLDVGFAVPNSSTTTVATLRPYGDTTSPNDMRDVVCHKKTPEEQSEAAPAAAANKPKSPYQKKLDHPTLIAISLGGATGPLPKAMRDADGNAYVDAPIPGWRPDLPPPAGFETAAQGDRGGD
jgi:D-alanyl-D-alanine carboxypeptidase